MSQGNVFVSYFFIRTESSGLILDEPSASTLYPNPNPQDQVFLNLEEDFNKAQVTVFDKQGATVFSQQINSKEAVLNLQGVKAWTLIL